MKPLVVFSVQTGFKADIDLDGSGFQGEFDRILFTDNPNLRSAYWEVRYFDAHGLEPARSSRRPKLMPHEYLAEYEWSLYIDGNIRLKTDPRRVLFAHKDRGPSFFAFPHPDRGCAYDEMEEVIRLDYDDERRVREQADHYQDYGFPRQSGLIAGGVLLRRHHDPLVISLGIEWFEHVLRYSRRDQLSFNFVAWRQGFQYGLLDGSLRDNSFISWPARPRSSRLTADFDPKVYVWLNPDVVLSGVSPEEHFVKAKITGTKLPRYKRHNWSLRKLANKYRSDKGDIYYNTHAYADVYEFVLRSMRDKPIRLLELGLLRHDIQARNPSGPYAEAPSLAMWRDYFPAAAIFGFDIADFSAMPQLPGVAIIRGDASSRADLERLIEITGGQFDVIVDDASHASHHQQIALAFLFDHLRPGGVYFIEDLNYQPPTLEVVGVTKTSTVLKGLARGELMPTRFIGLSQLHSIHSKLDGVEFFDSFDRNFGRLNTDALGLLRKTTDAKVKTFGLAGRARSPRELQSSRHSGLLARFSKMRHVWKRDRKL